MTKTRLGMQQFNNEKKRLFLLEKQVHKYFKTNVRFIQMELSYFKKND